MTVIMRGDDGKYSSAKASHISSTLISVPLPSVITLMQRLNSIWSRRGRSMPCSVFMM